MTMTLQLPSNLPYDYQHIPFLDIRKDLPVNPNYNWTQLAGERKPSSLTTIVCHHDAIPKAKSAKYEDVVFASRIATDHINSKKNHPKGDAGFPYDVWIRNGKIYWCNDIEQREYGVGGNNGYTVNVCVSGDYFNGDTMTEDDRKALYIAILMLKAVLPAYKEIKGHGEIVPTNCPGYNIAEVRNGVIGLEVEIKNSGSPTKKAELAYYIANQILWLYNMFYKGVDAYGEPVKEEDRQWALSEVLKLEGEMRKKGMLKKG